MCSALKIVSHSSVELVPQLKSPGHKCILTGKLGQGLLDVNSTELREICHDKCQPQLHSYLAEILFGIVRCITGDGEHLTATWFLCISVSWSQLITARTGRCGVLRPPPTPTELLLKAQSPRVQPKGDQGFLSKHMVVTRGHT